MINVSLFATTHMCLLRITKVRHSKRNNGRFYSPQVENEREIVRFKRVEKNVRNQGTVPDN